MTRSDGGAAERAAAGAGITRTLAPAPRRMCIACGYYPGKAYAPSQRLTEREAGQAALVWLIGINAELASHSGGTARKLRQAVLDAQPEGVGLAQIQEALASAKGER